jgi:hypothetical protein
LKPPSNLKANTLLHKQMNIFALSVDPKEAAKAHGDKHVVKMILEACQMLYTAHWISAYPELLKNKAPIKVAAAQKLLSVPENLANAPKRKDSKVEEPGYRPVHLHHPCTVWVRTSLANYMWLTQLALAIANEYEYRFAHSGKGKPHSCKAHARWLQKNPPPLPVGPRTPFALAMPDEYKMPDPVVSYIRFYTGSKKDRGLTTYTRRPPPNWL